MATVAVFSASPNPVPAGSRTTRLAVSFTLDPGTPDQILAGQVVDPAGTQQAQVTVTFKGTPPETLPVVAAAPTAGQWSIRVPSGTVAAVAGQANTFDWTA